MITLVARGQAVQQGSKVSMQHRTTGKVVQFETAAKGLRAWRDKIAARGEVAMDGREPLDGPVVLAITFTWARPVSAPKRKPLWWCTKPDWDKLSRAVCDGLKEAGVYRDDARVMRAVVIKSYPVALEDRAEPLYDGEDAQYMLRLWEPTCVLDVLNVPGAVIRVAHLTEFDTIRKQLAEAGYEPKDIPGGS